jgi:hypothetical protein
VLRLEEKETTPVTPIKQFGKWSRRDFASSGLSVKLWRGEWLDREAEDDERERTNQ